MNTRIAQGIRDASLDDAQVLAFCEALRVLAKHGSPRNSAVRLLEVRLRQSVEQECQPAPLGELWPHRELFLRACITAAVCEGEYRVESARIVGDYAQELGISARQLDAMECAVMKGLIARGREEMI